jgi:hypothetical protein
MRANFKGNNLCYERAILSLHINICYWLAIFIGYDKNLVKVMMELGKYYDLNLVSRLYRTMRFWEYSFNVAKSLDE